MRRAAVLILVLLLPVWPAGAGTTEPTVVGQGLRPGVGVDDEGTAYLAWNGLEPDQTTLRFCRLPRGATACDELAETIEAPGTSGSRPFVFVDGTRVVVVQHRYGGEVPGFDALYRFTSESGGIAFDEGEIVGRIDVSEAVAGPGQTVSGVTEANACGMCFQNVPLEGPAPDPVQRAVLSDRQYGGAVGLVGGDPLVVFAAADGTQAFRRYTGSGALNDEDSWTPAVELGAGLAYPILAGGPTGLFLLGSGPGGIFVRRFNGTTFGAPLGIDPAGGSAHHLVQDPGGRLHAVWERAVTDGLELVHAVSHDGATWTSGVAAVQSGPNDFVEPRVATAADHRGVAVWSSGVEREIRVVAVGPDAPGGGAPARPPVDGQRVDGGSAADPVGQAIATSQRLFADAAAARVVLATADRFPDALGGAALAGDDGPILLTRGLGALDPRVEAEIARVTGGDGQVLVLGGEAAVSAQAAAQAIAAGGGQACADPFPSGCRYAGSGREHTAALVAETVIAEHPGTTALVARGDVFADAVTGGAYAAATGIPVLFTPSDAVNEATSAFIIAFGISRVIALGGEAAVNQATLDALPADDRDRVAGSDRTATAVEIALQLWGESGIALGGALLVNVRHDQGWQTALTATVASALGRAPQIGVESPPAELAPETLAYFGTISGPIEVYGGVDLVSDDQLATAQAARSDGR